MHWRGHVGLAFLSCSPLLAWLLAQGHASLAAAVLAIAATFGVLPDADEPLPIRHRGLTHTIWFVGAVSVLVGAAATIALSTGPGRIVSLAVSEALWLPVSDPVPTPAFGGIVLAGAAALALASHLAGDVVTPMGLRPFAPLSDWYVTLDLTLSKATTVNRILFVAGLLAVAASVALFG